MKSPFNILLFARLLTLASLPTRADLVISQYVETDSGSTPKGIELWNSGSSPIDFSVTNLVVQQGTNGGALSHLPGTTVTSGILAPNAVLVIGTSEIGTYLTDTYGGEAPAFVSYSFNFNGDDALSVLLGGTVTDTLGTPGVDPGDAWSGSGVSTANQNLSLKSGITTGSPTGWTDPSLRYETRSSTPSGTGGLEGFGLAPIPEPAAVSLVLLAGALWLLRKRTEGA